MPPTQSVTPLVSNQMFCPRCDRPYFGKTADEALENVKKHVAEQHPDHDPVWWETYPESFAN